MLTSAITCITPDVLCTQFCSSTQGVRSRRNVHQLRRFMKNHVQIYVPKRPRTYEKHLLNLLKSSIPYISASTLTMFSIEILEKLCQTMYWRLLKTRFADFPVSKNRKIFCPFLHYHVFSREHL